MSNATSDTYMYIHTHTCIDIHIDIFCLTAAGDGGAAPEEFIQRHELRAADAGGSRPPAQTGVAGLPASRRRYSRGERHQPAGRLVTAMQVILFFFGESKESKF